MEAEELSALLEQLDDNVDDLEETLKPFQEQPLTVTANKLPVMDKAKLHILATYTLESLLFSYLRLKSVDAKSHPISQELTRLKQYFNKIKTLETEPEQRNLTLDKAAAGRFIKHGLAGNDKVDLERAEREAKEKAVAQLKASMISKKDGDSGKPSADPNYNHASSSSSSDDDDQPGDESPVAVKTKPGKQAPKERRGGVNQTRAERRKKKGENAKSPNKQKSIEKKALKKERRQKKKKARTEKQKQKQKQ